MGCFKLKKIEQEILFSAIEAYTGLVLSYKKVSINISNVNLIERQVETDKNRLEQGEISLTDLAQSEASLAGAKAKLIQAQNELIISKPNKDMGGLIKFLVNDIEMDELRVQKAVKKLQNTLGNKI